MIIKSRSASQLNQSGAAAIFVVMILMTLLALISISFSHLMNREVRQSLDRQLSAEAYYAAESGVNDAKAYLANGGTSSTGCAVPAAGSNSFVTNGDISGDGAIKYSCVAIDIAPHELIFNLKPGQSKIFKLTPANLGMVYFSWQRDSLIPSTPLGALGSLPPETSVSSTAAGMLRVAFYAVPPTAGTPGTDTNASLGGASRNYFLYPNAGSGNTNCGNNKTSTGCVDYASIAQNGAFVSGNCSNGTYPKLPYANAAKRYCNSGITDIKSSGTAYYVRVTAMYAPIIGALEVATPTSTSLQIPDNEGYIDITGTGTDVSQRVRAIITNAAEFDNPVNGLWSMRGICKLFRVPVENQGIFSAPVPEPADPNSGDGLCAASQPNNGGGGI